MSPPRHSPGFTSRKSGEGDDIPASDKDPDGSLEQTKRATVTDEMWLDTVQAAFSHFVQR